MKFIKYHKIPQFRDVIRTIQTQSDFKGKDEEGNPIYEKSEYPILEFKGTVKLHGTNAQISYKNGEIKIGKRSSLIGTEHLYAHFGFNQFVQVQHQQAFIDWFKSLDPMLDEGDQLIIYGEWAGTGIQKSVAISELPKSFYIFGVKVIDEDNNEYWHDSNQELFKPNIPNVYNINDFPTYSIKIDFNNPKAVQNTLVELTTKVEEECPVSSQLGVKGIGEGIVWTSFWKDEKYIFKVKGEKHSVSKVKTLADVDPVELQNINDFVNYACTVNRVEQAIQETGADSRSKTPDLLRWIANDIIKEETDVLVKNGLEWKQVAKQVSHRARLIYFELLDKL